MVEFIGDLLFFRKIKEFYYLIITKIFIKIYPIDYELSDFLIKIICEKNAIEKIEKSEYHSNLYTKSVCINYYGGRVLSAYFSDGTIDSLEDGKTLLKWYHNCISNEAYYKINKSIAKFEKKEYEKILKTL